MASLPGSLCNFPIFNFAWSLPSFSLKLPFLPDLDIDLDFSCPLD